MRQPPQRRGGRGGHAGPAQARDADQHHVADRAGRPPRPRPRLARQPAQMFWLAVRDEKLGDGVGVDDWVVPAVSVVVP